MGQQQLLLIVLGVIVVGIAIVVGINLFNANSIAANRDSVISDINNIAGLAMSHYKKPTSMGGGSNEFTGFVLPAELDTTANGTYTVTAAAATTLGLNAQGTEKAEDGSLIEYDATVDSRGIVSLTKVH